MSWVAMGKSKSYCPLGLQPQVFESYTQHTDGMSVLVVELWLCMRSFCVVCACPLRWRLSWLVANCYAVAPLSKMWIRWSDMELQDISLVVFRYILKMHKKKNFTSFGQPTRLITCANHGNNVICS